MKEQMQEAIRPEDITRFIEKRRVCLPEPNKYEGDEYIVKLHRETTSIIFYKRAIYEGNNPNNEPAAYIWEFYKIEP